MQDQSSAEGRQGPSSAAPLPGQASESRLVYWSLGRRKRLAELDFPGPAPTWNQEAGEPKPAVVTTGSWSRWSLE